MHDPLAHKKKEDLPTKIRNEYIEIEKIFV